MTDKPIIFSGEMVRAILAGRKTQTRRIIKPQPTSKIWRHEFPDRDELGFMMDTPHKNGPETAFFPAQIGDRFWVRESFARTTVAPIVETIDNPMVVYRVGDNGTDYGGPWKPAIHMPRKDSRITLIVTDVRVERLQDISETDARAEGIEEVSAQWPPNEEDGFEGAPYPSFADYGKNANGCFSGYGAAGLSFMKLWDSINDARGFGWAYNPWIVAYTFKAVFTNIDQVTP